MGTVEDRRNMKPSQGDPKVDSLAEDLRDVSVRLESAADPEGLAVTENIEVEAEVEVPRPQVWELLPELGRQTDAPGAPGTEELYQFVVHASWGSGTVSGTVYTVPRALNARIEIWGEMRECGEVEGDSDEHPLNKDPSYAAGNNAKVVINAGPTGSDTWRKIHMNYWGGAMFWGDPLDQATWATTHGGAYVEVRVPVTGDNAGKLEFRVSVGEPWVMYFTVRVTHLTPPMDYIEVSIGDDDGGDPAVWYHERPLLGDTTPSQLGDDLWTPGQAL